MMCPFFCPSEQIHVHSWMCKLFHLFSGWSRYACEKQCIHRCAFSLEINGRAVVAWIPMPAVHHRVELVLFPTLNGLFSPLLSSTKCPFCVLYAALLDSSTLTVKCHLHSSLYVTICVPVSLSDISNSAVLAPGMLVASAEQQGWQCKAVILGNYILDVPLNPPLSCSQSNSPQMFRLRNVHTLFFPQTVWNQ